MAKAGTRHDIIPSNPAAFNQFFVNLVGYLQRKTQGSNPAWGFIPSDALTELENDLADWKTAYEPTLASHTPEQGRQMRRVQAEKTKNIRNFRNRFLRFEPQVTDEDKDLMGLPIEDRIPTPINAPQLPPAFDVRYPAKGLVDVGALRPANDAVMEDERAYHGVAIHVGILDATPQNSGFAIAAVPKTGSDLPYSEFCRTR